MEDDWVDEASIKMIDLAEFARRIGADVSEETNTVYLRGRAMPLDWGKLWNPPMPVWHLLPAQSNPE
ncbi:hypothetical protein GCM10011380_00890 [Sphingomonas metalli]|uniref:Uncharacterized protein n=1 Tax=Sphingomonas metalli TaxID=1779358 RepID=A0A916WMQ0_9SPHN|nr:hypothetical protein [Sphingomonas metalli]GGB15268.1 hypothetical protein GCM10011380_00890 [Sphingomonas metalli]